jgi:hypothetical protein
MDRHKHPVRLLSIVIATRNRFPYAKSAIKSILAIRNQQFELVVQDNSETRELETWKNSEINDDRLVYRYTPPPLSSIANFIAALELVCGEYVCLIGDDDGINPEIIEAAEWAKEQDIDAITALRPASYIWPRTEIRSSPWAKMRGGDLTLETFGSAPFKPEVEDELVKVVRVGCSSYNSFALPKLYHGVIRASCLERIKKITGCVLGGLSPDIYAAIAIACVTNRIVVVDYPLTIAGVCGVSSSAVEGGRRQNVLDFKSAPHFRDRGNYDWSKEVPKLYCVEAIWADSGVAALAAMKREDLAKIIDVAYLCSACMIGNRGVTSVVWKHYLEYQRTLGRAQGIAVLALLFAYSKTLLGKQSARLLNRTKRIFGITSTIRLERAENITEATINLTQFLKHSENSFRKYIHAFGDEVAGNHPPSRKKERSPKVLKSNAYKKV